MKSIITTTLLLVSICQINGQNLINVPEDVPTLSDAVQLAQNGDTIYLSPGIYTDSVHITNKQLVILGEPGGASVLSPGENERSFVLLNAEVVFMHLRFDDFDLDSPPPNFGISASYSDVSVAHCEFRNMFTSVSLLWGDLKMHSTIISNPRNGKCILHNGGTFLLYNNLFYELSVTPISINRAHGSFFNNTVVGSTPNQYRGVIINSDSISQFYNNIIAGFGIGIQLIASDSVELAALRIYNNNIYDMAAPYWYEYNEDLSFPIYSGALEANPGTGEISVPPTFEDAADHDYTLHSTSPCIDAGINAFSFSVPHDLAGNERIVGPYPDMGAYEYASDLTSIDGYESFQNEVELYPNPSSDLVWVEFSDLFTGKVEILDVSGHIIQSLQVERALKISAELPVVNGLYLIRITSPQSTVIERVVKL